MTKKKKKKQHRIWFYPERVEVPASSPPRDIIDLATGLCARASYDEDDDVTVQDLHARRSSPKDSTSHNFPHLLSSESGAQVVELCDFASGADELCGCEENIDAEVKECVRALFRARDKALDAGKDGRHPLDNNPEQFSLSKFRFMRVFEPHNKTMQTGLTLEPLEKYMSEALRARKDLVLFGRPVRWAGPVTRETEFYAALQHFNNARWPEEIPRTFINRKYDNTKDLWRGKNKREAVRSDLRFAGLDPENETLQDWAVTWRRFYYRFLSEYRAHASVLATLSPDCELNRFAMRAIFRVLAGPKAPNIYLPAYLPDVEQVLHYVTVTRSPKAKYFGMFYDPWNKVKKGVVSLDVPDPGLFKIIERDFLYMKRELTEKIIPYMELNVLPKLRAATSSKANSGGKEEYNLTRFLGPIPEPKYAPLLTQELPEKMFLEKELPIYQRNAPWTALSTSCLTYFLREFCLSEVNHNLDKTTDLVGLFAWRWRLFSRSLRDQWLRLYAASRLPLKPGEGSYFSIFLEVLALLRMVCDTVQHLRSDFYSSERCSVDFHYEAKKAHLFQLGKELSELPFWLIPQSHLTKFCIADLNLIIEDMAEFCVEFFQSTLSSRRRECDTRRLAALLATFQPHAHLPPIKELLSGLEACRPGITSAHVPVGDFAGDLSRGPDTWVEALWRAVITPSSGLVSQSRTGMQLKLDRTCNFGRTIAYYNNSNREMEQAAKKGKAQKRPSNEQKDSQLPNRESSPPAKRPRPDSRSIHEMAFGSRPAITGACQARDASNRFKPDRGDRFKPDEGNRFNQDRGETGSRRDKYETASAAPPSSSARVSDPSQWTIRPPAGSVQYRPPPEVARHLLPVPHPKFGILPPPPQLQPFLWRETTNANGMLFAERPLTSGASQAFESYNRTPPQPVPPPSVNDVNFISTLARKDFWLPTDFDKKSKSEFPHSSQSVDQDAHSESDVEIEDSGEIEGLLPKSGLPHDLADLKLQVEELKKLCHPDFVADVTQILHLQDFPLVSRVSAAEAGADRLKRLAARWDSDAANSVAHQHFVRTTSALGCQIIDLSKRAKMRRESDEYRSRNEDSFELERLSLEQELLAGTVTVLVSLARHGTTGTGTSNESCMRRLANCLEKHCGELRAKVNSAQSQHVRRILERLLNVNGLSLEELVLLVRCRVGALQASVKR